MTVKFSVVKQKPVKIKRKPPNFKTKMRQAALFTCKKYNLYAPKKFSMEIKFCPPALTEGQHPILRKVSF
jgi:hypothetical protein